jgi:pimeloyl-ACP methyl ester carboxylesterase
LLRAKRSRRVQWRLQNAAWLAVKNPQRVRGLVLVAPPGLGIVPVPREVVAAFLDALERTGDLGEEFAPWFTEKNPSHRANAVQPMAATPRAILEATVRLWVDTSIIDDIAGLSVPVLVVAGAREPLYNPEFQRQTTLAVLPHAKMVALDTSHFIPCEEPAAVAALIMQFVAKLPNPTLELERAVRS